MAMLSSWDFAHRIYAPRQSIRAQLRGRTTNKYMRRIHMTARIIRLPLRPLLLASASVGACLAAAQPVCAQGANLSDDHAVQEVIVTAQRRAERLEDVPASVSVVTQDTLQAVGVTRFQDLGNSVPGLQIARTGVYTQPAIRGISTLVTGPGFENNIAFYMDGYYETNPLVTNGDLTNIKDVQVLKGPQGTLYGRNATGGAILVNTLDPTTTPHGSASVGYGSYNDTTAGIYLSGPLVPTLTASIAAYTRQNDGYIRDIAGFHPGRFSNTSVRAKLKFDPVDWASFTLGYNYSLIDDPRGSVYVEYDQLPPGFVGTSERDKSSLNQVPTARTETNQYRLTAAFKTPLGELTSRTGYGEAYLYNAYDFDGQPKPLLSAVGKTSTRTFQQSVDYNIEVIPRTSLVIGGLYYHDKFAVRDSEGFASGVMYSRYTASQVSEAIALYIDGTYSITDRLFLSAGARYNRESKDMIFATTVGVIANTLNAPVHKTFSSVTPRVNLRYELQPGMNVYASFSKGFKSGTFNPTAGPPSLALPVADERVDAYEIGFKGVMGPWRWDTAAYLYDYTNLQVSTTQIVAGQLVQVTGNAKAAKIYGAEAQINYAPSRNWDLGGSVAYNHARYTDIKNAVGTGVNPSTNQNTTSTQDWSDKVMVRAPAWTANIHASYTFPLLSGTMTLTAAVSYSAKYIPNNPSTFVTTTAPPNTSTKQRFWTSGYALVNLQASWLDPSQHYKLTAYVNNVTDERYLITNSGSTFGSYRQWSEPRTVGVRAGLEF
jgi:iron complex outermembrane receptor protein